LYSRVDLSLLVLLIVSFPILIVEVLFLALILPRQVQFYVFSPLLLSLLLNRLTIFNFKFTSSPNLLILSIKSFLDMISLPIFVFGSGFKIVANSSCFSDNKFSVCFVL